MSKRPVALPPDLDTLPSSEWRAAVLAYVSQYRDEVGGATAAQYERVLRSNRSRDPAMATNRDTFHGRRSATLWAARRLMRAWLAGGSTLPIAEACRLARRVAALRWADVRPASPTRRGSKKALSKLPEGWQQALFDAATPNVRDVLAVLELSGCRPEELSRGRGVGVRCRELPGMDGWRFECWVRGAKGKDRPPGALQQDRGQCVRMVRVETANAGAAWLAMRATEAGGFLRVRMDAESASNRILMLSRRLWPKRAAERRPSAYSFRHAFAAACKRQGVGEAEIAMAMGHASTRTQGCYGASHGRPGGGFTFVGATAARTPRTVTAPRLPPGHWKLTPPRPI